MPSASTRGLSALEQIKINSVDLWADRDAHTEYERFRKNYWNDPVGFARDCIVWDSDDGLTDYQKNILDHLPKEKRISVRGPHGLGKSCLAAVSILWFALTRDGDDWKVATTASAWRQLEKFLWPEIHKWSRKINWPRVGRQPLLLSQELLSLSLRLKTGEAFALASDDHNMIEGAHADHMLYVFDEAKAIPEATWDAAEGAMVNANSYWLAISTPGTPSGRFYDIQTRKPGYEDWWVRPVKTQEAIVAGRITEQWVSARKKQWGENSSVFQNRVAGEFASEDENNVIPLSWVEEANLRWERWREQTPVGEEGQIDQIGLDVARQGSDQTVFAFRRANVITELKKFSKADTMETAGRAISYMNMYLHAQVVVDVIGIGAGVYDRTYEQYPYRVVPFNASEGTHAMDKAEVWGFVDSRSASWWRLREMLDPSNGLEVCLPPDDELTGDLCAPRWRVVSNGKIRVESKDSIKERLRRSTDSADAVAQAFWAITTGGMEAG